MAKTRAAVRGTFERAAKSEMLTFAIANVALGYAQAKNMLPASIFTARLTPDLAVGLIGLALAFRGGAKRRAQGRALAFTGLGPFLRAQGVSLGGG